MNYLGLTQGLLGRARDALTPSAVAVGPNTYLAEKDFLKMLAIAFIVHMFAFGVYAIIPSEKVTDIPVRALSFKLGNEDKVAAFAPTPVAASANAPVAIAPPVMQAMSKDSWRATPNMPATVVPAPLKPLVKITPPARPVAKPKVVKIADQLPLQNPQTVPAPVAVAPQPQQYVREVGAPSTQVVAAAMSAASPTGAIGGEGAANGMTEQTAQATRARYTQEISAWVARHMVYPTAAGDREGRAVVRVRIDRTGTVRYYAIEQSSGLQVLDDAALDMIRRANPMPAAPANYPDSNLIEFLIPLNFKVPK